MSEPNTGPSLEEQAAALDNPNEPTELTVPEKFLKEDGSVDTQALLRSYQELEQKQGQQKPADADPDSSTSTPDQQPESAEGEQTPSAETGNPLDPFFAEYEESGKLSDESFEAIEKLGIPRAVAQSYIDNAVRLAEVETQAMIAEIGQDNYDAMTKWAESTRTPEENAAYNAAVSGFDGEARKGAVQSLHEAWKAANGITKTVDGSTDSRASVEPAFANESQMREAMRNPKFNSDPAYRASVYRRTASMMGVSVDVVKQAMGGALA